MDTGRPYSKVAKILVWKPSTMALMSARYGHFALEDLWTVVEAWQAAEGAASGLGFRRFPPQFSAFQKAEVCDGLIFLAGAALGKITIACCASILDLLCSMQLKK